MGSRGDFHSQPNVPIIRSARTEVEWERRASTALSSGSEELAGDALARKREHELRAATFESLCVDWQRCLEGLRQDASKLREKVGRLPSIFRLEVLVPGELDRLGAPIAELESQLAGATRGKA
jgi:hypothetical protein